MTVAGNNVLGSGTYIATMLQLKESFACVLSVGFSSYGRVVHIRCSSCLFAKVNNKKTDKSGHLCKVLDLNLLGGSMFIAAKE